MAEKDNVKNESIKRSTSPLDLAIKAKWDEGIELLVENGAVSTHNNGGT